jgi:D-alanine--poly(phosphoribitol) ligase subunit 2
MSDPTQTVLSFLRKTIDPELQLDTRLIETGLLDSFHVVELLAFVENEFDIRLEPTDVTQQDLLTPQNIVDLVVKLCARDKPAQ